MSIRAVSDVFQTDRESHSINPLILCKYFHLFLCHGRHLTLKSKSFRITIAFICNSSFARFENESCLISCLVRTLRVTADSFERIF